MVEQKLPKLKTRVRFPSPAPITYLFFKNTPFIASLSPLRYSIAMEFFFKMMLIGLMVLTVTFLVLGLLKMGKAGEQQASNRMMSRRLWAQAAAFLVVAILLYMKR
jgi:hypothetical protein